MIRVLRDAPEGAYVESEAWTSFEWKGKKVPRHLEVVTQESEDCVLCRPIDGLATGIIPLYAGLMCTW